MKYILVKVPDDICIGGEYLPHIELTKKEIQTLIKNEWLAKVDHKTYYTGLGQKLQKILKGNK